MNESEQNFESLRRLLALKRHEVPPPGYFNIFSRQVMACIRTGEVGSSVGLVERLGMAWLMKWFQTFETTPAYAGSFATVLCLLLLFGAVVAQRPEVTSQAFLQPAERETAPMPMVAAAAPMGSPALEQPSGQVMVEDNSTNPVVNFQNPSLALEQTPFSAQFVSYPVSGN